MTDAAQTPAAQTQLHQEHQEHQEDAAEAVVPYIAWVIPLAGAVMIFLLAFIAVSMA